MLVVATNEAGDTRVSSDGFQVVENLTAMADVVIRDGPVCETPGTMIGFLILKIIYSFMECLVICFTSIFYPIISTKIKNKT